MRPAAWAAVTDDAPHEPVWSRVGEVRVRLPPPHEDEPFPQTLRGAEPVPPPEAPEGPPVADMLARIDALEVEGEALRAALDAARAEIAKTAAAATRVQQSLVADAEPELLSLALAVASRIVGAEIATRPETVARWLHEELATCPLGPPVEVHVSPDVAEHAPGGPAPSWIVDRSLPKSTCEIRAGASLVEVSPSSRLRAVLEALEVRP